MVATSSDPPGAKEESPRLQQDDAERGHEPGDEFGRAGVRHLMAALTKVGRLQLRIILTKLKLTMMRVAISSGLFLGAAVFGILAVIFLFIALFHLLLR